MRNLQVIKSRNSIMLTSDTLSTFRLNMFAIMGLTCLAYEVLALLQICHNPFPFWILNILGIISAALIFAFVATAERTSAQQAF